MPAFISTIKTGLIAASSFLLAVGPMFACWALLADLHVAWIVLCWLVAIVWMLGCLVGYSQWLKRHQDKQALQDFMALKAAGVLEGTPADVAVSESAKELFESMDVLTDDFFRGIGSAFSNDLRRSEDETDNR